jgi:hypothetical protein
LITYCYEIEKKINEVEYQFFIAIKTIRNKEDHEVNFRLDGNLSVSGIVAAIAAIIKVQKIIEEKGI